MLSLVDLSNPIVKEHPLNKGLLGFWMPLPCWPGMKSMPDLTGRSSRMVLTSDIDTSAYFTPNLRRGMMQSTNKSGTYLSATMPKAIGGSGGPDFTYVYHMNSGDSITGRQRSVMAGAIALSVNTDSDRIGYLNEGVAWRSGPSSMATFTNYHFALTCVGLTVTVYFNGAAWYSNTEGSFGFAAGTGLLVASRESAANGNWGTYSVRAYDRALSAGEIAAIYNQDMLLYPDLLRWWQTPITKVPAGGGGAGNAVAWLVA